MWRWSPLELPEFARMLEVARSLAVDELPAGEALRVLRFAEAGSGIGTKLYLAKMQFGMSEMGYEISDDYLAKSAKMGVHAVKCDLRVDVPPWEKFDIVYMARPFKDDDVESQWERSVMDAMRPGAVLMNAYAAVKPYDWPCYYRRPFRGIWVKPYRNTTDRSSGQAHTDAVPVSAYDQMIRRSTTGSDPLVPEPGPR